MAKNYAIKVISDMLAIKRTRLISLNKVDKRDGGVSIATCNTQSEIRELEEALELLQREPRPYNWATTDYEGD